jgi:hypothetical protein
MGLHISHMRNFPLEEKRTLYMYFLDYGWPEGDYETIFRNSFSSMANRASQTGAVVFKSDKGIHFANEVLNWHKVNGLRAEEILPAILFTKTHPNYFTESNDETSSSGEGIGDVVLLPLRKACSTPDHFASVIESIFADLSSGLQLRSFQVAEHDPQNQIDENNPLKRFARKISNSILLEPNFAGLGIDIKKLFSS